MKILFIIPGDINLPTGGYRYDREILRQWDKSGTDYELLSLKGNYPFPNANEKAQALALVTALPDADIAVVDGLAGGAHPEFVKKLSEKYNVIALIHHPLCLETGLEEEQASALKQSELEGLSHVNCIITSSAETAKTVHNLFGYSADKIFPVLPGVEREKGITAQSNNSDCVNLLCIGSVIERKGHRYLIEALAQLKHLNWNLRCIGMYSPTDPLYQSLLALVKTHSLDGRIIFEGGVSEERIKQAYSNTDSFVLPSLYEGYGMAYAEAIVRGIPVIGTTAGAIPDTVPDGCGILAKPANTHSLKEALEEMITNPDTRQTYAQECQRQEPNFPTWERSADEFKTIVRKHS